MPSAAEQLEQSQARIAELTARLANLERSRDERIAQLQEQIRWLKHQLFGRSSEKRVPEDVPAEQARLLFNEAEVCAASIPAVSESISIPAHSRQPRGRKKLPAELPRIEVMHDLPEADKVCPKDGTPLVKIGEATAEQLDYQPARLRIVKHVRPKYACPCCEQTVTIAPPPAQLLPKSLASPRLLAHVTTAKYVDGLPLHRQEAQFARLGIRLPRATMARWLIELGTNHLVPIVNLLNDQLLEAPLIHMDETRVQVLRSEKAPTSDHWMWVRAAGPPGKRIVLLDYDPARAGHVPARLLADYSGILLTDGYEAYDAVVKAQALLHAGCWAHARRRFEEARKVNPDTPARARIALDYIGSLYGIERGLKERAPEERLTARAERSATILTHFKTWLDAMAEQVLPQSALGKAVHYTLGQWEKLTRFLSHGEIPLDNNRCENAIRPFVIGRKNWLFSDTVAGATASANLYSLIETAKANGLEPHAYLTHLYAELPRAPTVEAIEALLPWNVKAARKIAS